MNLKGVLEYFERNISAASKSKEKMSYSMSSISCTHFLFYKNTLYKNIQKLRTS